MGYTYSLTISQMKELNILDEVPYKCFKEYDDEDDIKVNIYDADGYDDRPKYCTVVFEYELRYVCSQGSKPLYATEKFKTKITYNTSSPFALFLHTFHQFTDDEDESDYTTDDESE